MAKTMFFPHAFTLGLGPGKAASIRAGDVVKDVPDDLAVMLKARFGATENLPDGAEAVDIKRRLLDDEVAAKLSHPLVEKRLKPSKDEALAERMADQADAIRDLAAAIKKG